MKKYANITDADVEKPIQRLTSTKVAKMFKHTASVVKESKATVLSPNYMERYEFNKDKLQAWADEGIGFDTMKKFGVRYDSFSDRIVYPIKDYNGNIINVSGRTLDKDYKEKGIRKYSYFMPLGCLNTLYGFSDNEDSIRTKREVIVFEGAKSVMLASGWGVQNCVAILTSHLNPRQLLFFIKLGVRVVFALDEDVDISEDINIKKLKRYVSVEWVKNIDNLLSPKMSPVDAGLEVWQNLYERRKRIN